MMRYDFPVIRRIEDVLPAIQGEDAFIVAERDYGTIINYRQMGTEVFPPIATAGGSARMRAEATRNKILRRECRGLIFDVNGDLISRPYHKFFNAGERTETLLDVIPFDQPHNILEKLDGSMIRPLRLADGSLRMGTKMGLTGVSAQVDPWVAERGNYVRFMDDCLRDQCTPIFEWCSRQQRIVIDHPVDRLVLTAVRDCITGAYLTYTQLQELAGEYGVDLVRQFEGSVESMQSLMDHTRDLQDAEGYVVRWLDGHMVKIKGEQYCQIHRAKEGILRENGVIGMMLDEKLDDVKGFLFVEDRDALEQFETEFWRGISLKAVAWQAAFDVIKCVYGDDRKGFALVAAQSMEAFQRQAMFKAWDEGDFDWQQAVLDTVRRNISTGVKTDAARHLWGGVRWDGSPMMGSE
jgi:RNA ligase